jgi:uncharacterized protein (DUF488 family)
VILSVGYEGTSLDHLVARLRAAEVATVVAVRRTPASRRPGFSRRWLSEALEAAGIEYVSERDLGNPPDNRDAFRRGDPAAVRRMRAIVAGPGADALDRVVARASAARVALLCICADHAVCHRRIVADMAVEQDPTIEVLPLP